MSKQSTINKNINWLSDVCDDFDLKLVKVSPNSVAIESKNLLSKWVIPVGYTSLLDLENHIDRILSLALDRHENEYVVCQPVAAIDDGTVLDQKTKKQQPKYKMVASIGKKPAEDLTKDTGSVWDGLFKF